MGETLVRLEGAQELIVEKMTESGMYKNKSEVIRAGLLELGRKHRVFKDFKELEDELALRKMIKIDNEIKQGKRKVWTEEQVKKKHGFA
jgi:Arc/MetJ-type ribon-helix-helix transcriptional regulator